MEQYRDPSGTVWVSQADYRMKCDRIAELEVEVKRQEGIVLQLRDEITKRWADQPEIEWLKEELSHYHPGDRRDD